MRRTLATFAAAALLALSACSSSGDGGDGESSGGSADVAAEGPAPAAAERDADGAALSSTADLAYADSAEAAEKPAEAAAERSIISTGNVALRSDDVAQAVFDIGKVVDSLRGEVEEKNTETDKTGEVVRSRMVLRVPTADYADAMTALEGSADLISSGGSSKDVTTQVLDVDIRVQVQRRSIQRIALLLDRAESIRDIVAIEAQLSQRQADLASLEKQQDVLADQTAMSTITVSVERTKEPAPAAEQDEDEAGFLTGLDAGWDALKTFAVGVATFLGAVLPWTLVLLVLGLPGWTLVRRLRRRPAPASAA